MQEYCDTVSVLCVVKEMFDQKMSMSTLSQELDLFTIDNPFTETLCVGLRRSVVVRVCRKTTMPFPLRLRRAPLRPRGRPRDRVHPRATKMMVRVDDKTANRE